MSKLDYTVDILNVGFGLCVVAYPTQDRFPVLVVDGGFDLPEKYTGLARPLEEHLRRLGIREIDLMVASHPHRDHIGGLSRVVESMPVHRFLTGVPPFVSLPYGEGSETNMAVALKLYGEMLEQLHRSNAHTIAVTGTTRIGCGRAQLTVCTPSVDGVTRWEENLARCRRSPDLEAFRALSSELNQISLVASLSINGVTFMLPGDQNLTRLWGWEQVIFPADILVIPHHGDTEYLSQEAVQAIGAATAVVSADVYGTNGMPSPQLEESLTAWGIQRVLYTSGSRQRETAAGVRFQLSSGGEVTQQWIE